MAYGTIKQETIHFYENSVEDLQLGTPFFLSFFVIKVSNIISKQKFWKV